MLRKLSGSAENHLHWLQDVLLVLERLAPAQRIAFVLHDVFAIPFDEIADIVGCTSTAARQLASRARRRVQGAATLPDTDLTSQRAVVDAFLAASRGGDFDALFAVLDPEVVLRIDYGVVPVGAEREVRGASAVAEQFLGRAQGARPALVNGAAGAIAVVDDQLFVILGFTIRGGKIVEIDALADRERLRQLRPSILKD